jgi:hypothetical protein
MQASTLAERLADWHADLAVDAAARLVKNVALTGCDSRNGYRYADAALRSALPLYDQKPVFLDHAADRARPLDRSTRDLVGTIINPRFEAGRIRGDIRVLDTDSGRTFLALTTSNAPGVGMSHVVLARRSADGAVVESIEDVVSVDAVINPATTTTFRESTASQGDSWLRTDLPASDPTPESNELSLARSQVAALSAELATLRDELASLATQREQEVHSQRMDALILESHLPDYALTPHFRQLLAAAPDDSARRSLIQERLDLLHRAARHPPHSTLRRTRDTPATTTAAFLAAVKRR